mmetsp:Transcript_59114/g.117470  ORF Transcript_59114/g.117470 Transcript_59114/m.117470 type:complete len:259 (-) Transcript_59114:111-887(-)
MQMYGCCLGAFLPGWTAALGFEIQEHAQEPGQWSEQSHTLTTCHLRTSHSHLRGVRRVTCFLSSSISILSLTTSCSSAMAFSPSLATARRAALLRSISAWWALAASSVAASCSFLSASMRCRYSECNALSSVAAASRICFWICALASACSRSSFSRISSSSWLSSSSCTLRASSCSACSRSSALCPSATARSISSTRLSSCLRSDAALSSAALSAALASAFSAAAIASPCLRAALAASARSLSTTTLASAASFLASAS